VAVSNSIFFSACPTDLARRAWISANGKSKIEAKFLRAEAGKVVRQENDGTEIEVAEENLSQEDVDWVKSDKWKTWQ
jgi:hypothetical protein